MVIKNNDFKGAKGIAIQYQEQNTNEYKKIMKIHKELKSLTVSNFHGN